MLLVQGQFHQTNHCSGMFAYNAKTLTAVVGKGSIHEKIQFHNVAKKRQVIGTRTLPAKCVKQSHSTEAQTTKKKKKKKKKGFISTPDPH